MEAIRLIPCCFRISITRSSYTGLHHLQQFFLDWIHGCTGRNRECRLYRDDLKILPHPLVSPAGDIQEIVLFLSIRRCLARLDERCRADCGSGVKIDTFQFLEKFSCAPCFVIRYRVHPAVRCRQGIEDPARDCIRGLPVGQDIGIHPGYCDRMRPAYPYPRQDSSAGPAMPRPSGRTGGSG